MTVFAQRHGLLYRPGTADENVLADVFDRRQYDLATLPIKPPPTIDLWVMDAGAHIGAASVWFLRAWPWAQVVALEPDPENHALLQRNLPPRGLGYRAALTGRAGEVALVKGLDTWSHQVEPGVGTPSMTMASWPDFHVVKIDIEGSEADVFAGDTAWVDRTPIIMIELHDWLFAGSGDSYRACVSGRDRETFNQGEVTISVRRDWLA